MTNPHPITASARSWVGTKFHHQGRLKKTETHSGGVDCLGLLVGVAKECHLTSRSGEPLFLLDETDYSHTPDVARLYHKLCGALTSVALTEMQEADVVLMHVLNPPQHLGVVASLSSPRLRGDSGGNYLTLIHAYAQAGRVIEHPLTEHWRRMITAAFRVAP